MSTLVEAPARARPQSLRASVSWTLLGNVVYAASRWGVIVVLSQLGTPEAVGEFALATALTAPVVLFFSLQLRQVQATDATGEHPFAEYLRLQLLTCVAAMAVIAGIAVATGRGRTMALLIGVMGLAKCVENISEIYTGLRLQAGRMDLVAKSLLLKGPLSLLLLGLTFWLTGNLLWSVMAMAAAFGLVLVGYDMPSPARIVDGWGHGRTHAGRRAPSFRSMGRLARRALPLGLGALLTSLVINVPRLFVDKYLGSADLGVFAALTYVIVVGSVAVNAMAQSVGPRLARAIAVGDARRYRRLIAAASAWCAAIGLGGVLAAAAGGAPLLTLLYGRTYAPYTGVLVIVMLAGLFTYVSAVFEIATTARRFLGAHALINVSRIVLTIGLCVTLIPTNGLIGAAWAIALAQGAAMLMYAATACVRMPRPVQPAEFAPPAPHA